MRSARPGDVPRSAEQPHPPPPSSYPRSGHSTTAQGQPGPTPTACRAQPLHPARPITQSPDPFARPRRSLASAPPSSLNFRSRHRPEVTADADGPDKASGRVQQLVHLPGRHLILADLDASPPGLDTALISSPAPYFPGKDTRCSRRRCRRRPHQHAPTDRPPCGSSERPHPNTRDPPLRRDRSSSAPRSVIRRNRAAGSLSLHPPCSPVTEDRWINGAEQTAPDPEIRQ